MRKPAAKEGDHIIATDTHIVLMPVLGVGIPLFLAHQFDGIIDDGLSANVNIMGKAAATVDSTATNTPAHFPTSPGATFQKAPKNKGTIKFGSGSVNINGKPAARAGDIAETCNDPIDLPVGQVSVNVSSVFIG